MNFNMLEQSLDQRKPARMYQFSRGPLRWCYNSSAEVIKYDNQIFKPLIGGISDRGIIRSDGGQSDTFIITAPNDIEVAQLFVDVPPSSRIQLTVFNTHLGTECVQPVWYGVIGTVNFSVQDSVEISCINNETLTNRPGVTAVYSRQCNAVLYDKQCAVNKEKFKVAATIKQITPMTIEVMEAGSYSPDWFTGGFIEFNVGSGEIDRRYIEKHTGTTLTLLSGSISLKDGQNIALYPGCNLMATTCQEKFNNLLNRKAFDHLQGQSPFDGNPVGW